MFEICQKEVKEKRRKEGGEKRKRGEKNADARVHTRERAGKLVGNNESIFQTVENGYASLQKRNCCSMADEL